MKGRRAGCALGVVEIFMVACALAPCAPRIAALGHGAIALGQLSVKGEAVINGVRAVGGASVFSGDRVTTRKGSTVSVSMRGGNELVLAELTSVKIVGAQSEITVPLDNGRLEYLSGPELPIVVRARGIAVVPQGGGGVYAVALSGDSLRVTATKGFAELESANGSVKVAEGKTLVATLEADEPGGVAVHSKGRIVKYVIIAAGVAGGAGLSLALVHANSDCAVSPSNVGNCASPH